MLRILKNYDSRWGEGPGDALIYETEATLVAGAATVALKGIVKEGAPVYFRVFKEATVTSGNITVNDTIGATDTVKVQVLFDAKDQSVAGEVPVNVI